MECRKLIKFGRSSFVVSLPKKWINANKLVKGDLLFLEQATDRLVISARMASDRTPREIAISSDKKDFKHVASEIISAYLNNFDTIKIVGESQARDFQTLLAQLPGLEIIQQNPHSMVAKDLLDRNEVLLEPLFRRVDMIIRSMLTDALEREDLFERDREVNRLVFLITRVLRSALDDPSVARSLKMNSLQIMKHWTMIKYLESVGDEVKRISRHLEDGAGVELLKEFGTAFQRVMKSYHTGQNDEARKIEQETKERSDLVAALLRDHPKQVKLAHHLQGLSALLKNMARLCTDFTAQETIPGASLIEPLEKETGFLK